MTLTPHVAEWLTRADEDLRAAVIMLAEGSLPNPICFHAQQVAEKALKGYLAANEQHVRKTHALDDLIVQCAKRDIAFEQMRDDAVYLTQFYTEARYPGDFPSFTMEQARRAMEARTNNLVNSHPIVQPSFVAPRSRNPHRSAATTPVSLGRIGEIWPNAGRDLHNLFVRASYWCCGAHHGVRSRAPRGRRWHVGVL